MRYKNLLTIIIFAIIFSSTLFSCKGDEKESINKDSVRAFDDLTFDITVFKKNYKVGEEIKLKFQITNISDKTVELPVKEIFYLSKFIKAGLVNNNKVEYASAFIAKDFKEPFSKNQSLMTIDGGKNLEAFMFLKISPISRLSIIPYKTKKLFLELDIKEQDYEKELKQNFKRVIGTVKSNEVDINIDSSRFLLLSNQYSDIDHIVNYFRLRAKNTDQLVTESFRFRKDDEITRDMLHEVNKYIKTFRIKDKFVFFEFYKKNELMAYAELFYNLDNKLTDFVMYYSNGQIDIRYEAFKLDENNIRWDKYVVDYLRGLDIYIGYIIVSKDKNGLPYISKILMEYEENKYKRFDYDERGSVINREFDTPPQGTQMRKRKF